MSLVVGQHFLMILPRAGQRDWVGLGRGPGRGISLFRLCVSRDFDKFEATWIYKNCQSLTENRYVLWRNLSLQYFFVSIHNVNLTSHTWSQALNDICKRRVVVFNEIARFNSQRNLHVFCVTFTCTHRSFSFSLSLAHKNTHSVSRYGQKEVWDSGMNKV